MMVKQNLNNNLILWRDSILKSIVLITQLRLLKTNKLTAWNLSKGESRSIRTRPSSGSPPSNRALLLRVKSNREDPPSYLSKSNRFPSHPNSPTKTSSKLLTNRFTSGRVRRNRRPHRKPQSQKGHRKKDQNRPEEASKTRRGETRSYRVSC